MGWSLDYQGAKDLARIEEFLLAVGKALYLASAFEAKCRGMLQIARIVRHLEHMGDDLDAACELTRAMRDKLLADTIRELATFPEFKATDIAVLDRARRARNVIAHEIAELEPLSRVSTKVLSDRIARLRLELAMLIEIEGDNLVSRWIFEIEEKRPAPRDIQQQYPHWVKEWVFSAVSGRGHR